jgi:hypothetical protein
VPESAATPDPHSASDIAEAAPSPSGSSGGGEVTRLVSAGVEGSLERFSDPTLLAQGKVNMISLEAVQARMAKRWELRKDQVHSFAERVLERGLAGQGLSMRVSDTDFFIVQPDLGRLAGQAACLRFLREILNHFLGDTQMAAAGVLQVTKFTNGRLEAKQVDASQAEADVEVHPRAGAAWEESEAEHDAAREGRHSPAWEDTAPESRTAVGEGAGESSLAGAVHLDEGPAGRLAPARPVADGGGKGLLNPWTPFISNDGRQLRVSATLEPVYEVKGFSRIGFRMVRRVIVVQTDEELTPQQVVNLSAADLLKVDLATITRGIDRLKGEAAGELSLIVPLSFSSLSSARGRTELIPPLKEAGRLVKLGVICEICDIDGVPPGALLAATSLVRPFSLLVVGRLNSPSASVIGKLRDAGLQALSFECPITQGNAEFVGWATAAIKAAKAVAKSVLVYRAGSTAQASVLATLGASHVSLTPAT